MEFFILFKITSSKNAQLWQYLTMKFSFIFQFQLVPFVFTLISGDPFIMTPPPKVSNDFFFKKNLAWEDKHFGCKLMEGALHWETDQIMARGRVSQMHFLVI